MAVAYVSLRRTDRAVLAVNGFAADGNMFVKNVKQRLEVRQPDIGAIRVLIESCPRSGIATHMQKTCPCARSRG